MFCRRLLLPSYDILRSEGIRKIASLLHTSCCTNNAQLFRHTGHTAHSRNVTVTYLAEKSARLFLFLSLSLDLHHLSHHLLEFRN